MKKLLVLVLLMVALFITGCAAEEVEYRRAGYRWDKKDGEYYQIITVADIKGNKYEIDLFHHTKYEGIKKPMEDFNAICQSKYLPKIVNGKIVDWEIIPQEERIEVFKHTFSNVVKEIECKNVGYIQGFLNNDPEQFIPIVTVEDQHGLQYDIDLRGIPSEDAAIISVGSISFKLKVKGNRILEWEVTEWKNHVEEHRLKYNKKEV